MLELPSNETPLIATGVFNLVAVSALPATPADAIILLEKVLAPEIVSAPSK